MSLQRLKARCQHPLNQKLLQLVLHLEWLLIQLSWRPWTKVTTSHHHYEKISVFIEYIYGNSLTKSILIMAWHFSDCFKEQHAKKSYIRTKPNSYLVNDAYECQMKCQERDECKYFEHKRKWYGNEKNCWLKEEDAKKKAKYNKDFLIGPKYCHGMTFYTVAFETM